MVTTRAVCQRLSDSRRQEGRQPADVLSRTSSPSAARAGSIARRSSRPKRSINCAQAMRKREEQLGAARRTDEARDLPQGRSDQEVVRIRSPGSTNSTSAPRSNRCSSASRKIKKERADYAKRLEAGNVSDEEQRDRAMAEQKLTPTELPIMGAIIAKVARFGEAARTFNCAISRKKNRCSATIRDSIRCAIASSTSIRWPGSVAAKLARNDNGTAFRVADHFKACWRNQDKAEELYGQHRAALREDRGLCSRWKRATSEAEIIERLASLSLDGRRWPEPANSTIPAAKGASAPQSQ